MLVLWILVGLLAVVLACGIACATVLRVTLGRPYPTFLALRHWPRQDPVPVILYHAVTPRYLRRELQYLKDNGYETIGAGTLVARLNGEDVALPRRPILLTFDDGHESLWSVAYPL
jgi:peptidoglycan/xylan/chitin deacetylase (PgdA/CDA1 family)